MSETDENIGKNLFVEVLASVGTLFSLICATVYTAILFTT